MDHNSIFMEIFLSWEGGQREKEKGTTNEHEILHNSIYLIRFGAAINGRYLIKDPQCFQV